MWYETKGCDPFIAFKGAYFLYATNTLHPMLSKPSGECDEDELTNRGAINARMKRHHFKVCYSGKDKLPFTVKDIALALHYLNDKLKDEDYVAAAPVLPPA